MEERANYRIELTVRGVLALIFGVLAFALPIATAAALVVFFGTFALIDGVILVWTGVRGLTRNQLGSGYVIFQGVVSFLFGLATWVVPEIAALTLMLFMASWAIVIGVFEIAAAIKLRKEIADEWLLGLSGLASVLLGVLLVAMPGVGLVAWAWMLGAYALASGVFLLILAFQIKSLPNNPARRLSRV